VENTLPLFLNFLAKSKQSHDSCGDFTLSSVIMTNELIRNAYSDLLKRGIKSRFITEITEGNIAYCKELMKIVYELRHLERVRVNFLLVNAIIQPQLYNNKSKVNEPFLN
jgi:chaperonin GroEL (HSP60 family)